MSTTPQTSSIGPYTPVEGSQLEILTGSPATYTNICNVSDIALPIKADKIDVTNIGDLWHRKVPTLLDMGNITAKVWWIPSEKTHGNTTSSTATGLRYLLLNRQLATFKVVYPDTGASSDSFPAYVTGFAITGKVGGAFEATLELSNSGAPTLV